MSDRGYIRRLSPQPLLVHQGELSDTAFAEILGTTPRSVQRYRAGSPMKLSAGETFAHRLGLHPLQIWGVEYTDKVAEGQWRNRGRQV